MLPGAKRGTGPQSKLFKKKEQTDRDIPNNKPDIIIRDNENRACICSNPRRHKCNLKRSRDNFKI
jgi:hypothetical protein